MEGKTHSGQRRRRLLQARDRSEVAAWSAAVGEEEVHKELEDEAGPVRRCVGERHGAAAALGSWGRAFGDNYSRVAGRPTPWEVRQVAAEDAAAPDDSKKEPEPLAVISSCLRSDPRLNEEAATALDQMVKAAYRSMRNPETTA